MVPSSKYNKLQGKHVIVIGGSSGIGLGIAEASLVSGAGVVTITSSSRAKIDTAVSRLSSYATSPDQRVQGFTANLAGEDAESQLDAVFQQAVEAAGTIHHVVFTAADALSLTMLQDMTPEKILAACQMRFVAPLLAAKVAARYLPPSRESSLTLTSGSAAWKSTPGWALGSYFSGGLQAVTRQLAVELKPVRVNAVAPGFIDTGLWGMMSDEVKAEFVRNTEATVPTGKFGQVEDVVEAYLWVMKDGNATGTVAGSDSGFLVV